jgi:ATP-dependent helicase/nuclease subunit B
MSMRFVLGRAGSGKTNWCLREIVQACQADPLGSEIFWIVPRQATFLAERLLACGSDLPGYFRCRVMSFEDLGRHVLSECGGAATGEISELGRRLILGHVLRNLQPQLQFFKDVALQPGMAAELDGTLAELERCGVAAADLADQSPKIATPSLKSKIHDLNLIYSAYTQFLGQERLDPHSRLGNAIDSIQRSPSLRNTDVYVDSFFDFTHRQREVLAALAKTCRQVRVTLTTDPDHPSITNVHKKPDELDEFHRSIVAYHRLWFACSEKKIALGDPVLLRASHRFKNNDLARLEQWQAPKKPSGAIQFVEADDRRAEVDATARWILSRVAEGVRYRDIAVLMRTEEDYRSFIDASFHEHGIPFFIDRRRTAAHHPLPRFIRAALAVAKTNFARDAVIALLKTDLTDLNSQEGDELENYVLQQGIDHALWKEPWRARRRAGTDENENSLEAIDARQSESHRKRLITPLIPFVQSVNSHPQTIRGMAAAIFSLLEALKVRTRISTWMEQARRQNRLEEEAEHKLVWDQVAALFEEMVELLGDQPTNLADFQALLDLALEGLQLAIAPPTVDQVLVGSIDRTRTPEIKACAILGLSEGQFPRLNREGTVFTDSDRRALDTERQLLDENFLAYIAITRASHHLLLTRASRSKPGQPIAPSPLWQRIHDLFPESKIESGPNEDRLPLSFLATPRQLLSGLMHWVRDNQSPEADAWTAVYDWLARRPDRSDALDQMRIRAWKSLSYKNKAELPNEISGRLFTSPLNVSIRQLEDFRACPYRHFARHALDLRPRQERRTRPSDLAHIYHDVLDELTRELIESQTSWSDIGQNPDTLIALVERAAERLNSELLLPTSRSRYLIDRIAQTLRRVTAGQAVASQRGDFRPRWTNLPFGDEPRGMPPLHLRTPKGQQILIHGKIDRVDLTPDGLAAVVDYRLKAGPLGAAAIYHGVSLKLLVDLLALRENSRHLSKEKITPVAAFCVGLYRDIKHDDPAKAPSPEEPRFHLQNKPRGIVDIAAVPKFDKQFTGKLSEVLNVSINQDGQIGNQARSDAVQTHSLNRLLNHTRDTIAQLAQGILAGTISVKPYRLAKQTPCSRCEYQDLCRFDPAAPDYDHLELIDRQEMLKRVSNE